MNALKQAGWTITHDPLRLVVGNDDLYIDLGAERSAIAAKKDGQQIAVEVKTFLGRSTVKSLEDALGQYRLYLSVLAELQPDRVLYLAIPLHVYEAVFTVRLGQIVLQHDKPRLIVLILKQKGLRDG
ncbi:MAG TPA: element excision factor XisH family protein [Blastocatellia bacterium]|nr:element excision factor XisH family protein [Blastocatellia bacterium]